MKREIVIPVLISVLGLVFIIINIIVLVSRGNSWLIKRKLKVGAMILSLTGILACGSPQQPTCYQQPVTNDHADSIADAKKQDSLKQKLADDSIVNVMNEQRKKDSLAKINHKKKPKVIKPTCYKPAPPRPTCYDMAIDTNKIN
jgi:hypothetical protein